MSKTYSGENEADRKPFNSRALMAILSRLISGTILSLMFFQYFSSQGGGPAFVTSRLWWEIALNMQLLSAGMMWFSYADRISQIPGPLRRLQLTKCWLAILAVSTPFVVGLVAVLNDWFIAKPPPIVFAIIIGLAVVHMAISLLVYRMIERYRQKRKEIYTVSQQFAFLHRRYYLQYWPLLVCLAATQYGFLLRRYSCLRRDQCPTLWKLPGPLNLR